MTVSIAGRTTDFNRPLLFTKCVTQRFRSNSRGRLVSGKNPGSSPVPRFYFARTWGLTLWRFSAALDSECVLRAARLAALERPLPREAVARLEAPPPPPRLEALAERIGGDETAGVRFQGPLLVLNPVGSKVTGGKLRIREFALDEAPNWGEKKLASGGPGARIEVAGEAVAVCRSVRHWPGFGAECFLETAEDERGHGYGRAALRAWCEAILRKGEIPMARPQWSEHGFLRLAEILGAHWIGEEFEFD